MGGLAGLDLWAEGVDGAVATTPLCVETKLLPSEGANGCVYGP